MRGGEILTGAAPERVKRVQSKFLWLPYAPNPEQGLPVEAPERDSTSTCRCTRRA